MEINFLSINDLLSYFFFKIYFQVHSRIITAIPHSKPSPTALNNKLIIMLTSTLTSSDESFSFITFITFPLLREISLKIYTIRDIAISLTEGRERSCSDLCTQNPFIDFIQVLVGNPTMTQYRFIARITQVINSSLRTSPNACSKLYRQPPVDMKYYSIIIFIEGIFSQLLTGPCVFFLNNLVRYLSYPEGIFQSIRGHYINDNTQVLFISGTQ